MLSGQRVNYKRYKIWQDYWYRMGQVLIARANSCAYLRVSLAVTSCQLLISGRSGMTSALKGPRCHNSSSGCAPCRALRSRVNRGVLRNSSANLVLAGPDTEALAACCATDIRGSCTRLRPNALRSLDSEGPQSLQLRISATNHCRCPLTNASMFKLAKP